MKIPKPVRCALLLVSVFLAGCGGQKEPPIVIFAAVSTREALREAANKFEEKTGAKVEVNAGPSSTLARQIEQGALADLFLSADESWADYLEGKGLAAKRGDLLSNQLVVVVPARSELKIRDLDDLAQPGVKRLALAAPAVPAGRYAREALTKTGTWDAVKDRILQGGDVRAALTYVARGEAEAGLVYASDVRISSEVKKAFTIAAGLHSPIRYPLVLVKRAPSTPSARDFYDFLLSEPALETFRKHGFETAP